MKKLIIIGATEFAEIACEYFTKAGKYEVEAFSVDKKYINSNSILGLPVVSFETLEEHYPPSEYYLFTAVTYNQLNRTRERFYLEGKKRGYQFASYISPHAFVWDNVLIGENTFIFENNVLQYNVKIGNSVVLWSGNHIGHSAEIGDYCFLASHAVISGYCKVGRYSFIGVNATMGNNIELPEDSVLAAGAVMTHSFGDKGKSYAGNPAKEIRKTAYECFGLKVD